MVWDPQHPNKRDNSAVAYASVISAIPKLFQNINSVKSDKGTIVVNHLINSEEKRQFVGPPSKISNPPSTNFNCATKQ